VTRILGIDPGSHRTGIGIIDVVADGRCRYVHAQALVLLDAADFPSRLGLLCDGLDALIAQWQPQQVAIETVFMDKSAMSLSARRVISAMAAWNPAASIAALTVAKASGAVSTSIAPSS
jgi:crossover junction endodeoxyribonuclease RuvC